MSRFYDEMPLGEARAILRELAQVDGEKCPCCTQFTRVYRRQIHAGMAHLLIRLYHLTTPGEFIYLPDVPQKSRDGTGLHYWDLIAEETALREDGGRSGWWVVSPLGREFVERRITVPRYARIFDGRRLGYIYDEYVGIVDCLGKKFDYTELMNA